MDMEFWPADRPPSTVSRRSRREVIVSDMRMPGMDGWQLLAEVKSLYPQTVRLVCRGMRTRRHHAAASGRRTNTLRSPARAHPEGGHRPNPLKDACSQAMRLALMVGDVGILAELSEGVPGDLKLPAGSPTPR